MSSAQRPVRHSPDPQSNARRDPPARSPQDVWAVKPHNRRLLRLMVDIFAGGDMDVWVRLQDGMHLNRYPAPTLKDRFTADVDQETRSTLIEECWMLGHRGIARQKKAVYIAHASRVTLTRPGFFDLQFKKQRQDLAPLIRTYIAHRKAGKHTAMRKPANT